MLGSIHYTPISVNSYLDKLNFLHIHLFQLNFGLKKLFFFKFSMPYVFSKRKTSLNLTLSAILLRQRGFTIPIPGCDQALPTIALLLSWLQWSLTLSWASSFSGPATSMMGGNMFPGSMVEFSHIRTPSVSSKIKKTGANHMVPKAVSSCLGPTGRQQRDVPSHKIFYPLHPGTTQQEICVCSSTWLLSDTCLRYSPVGLMEGCQPCCIR